MDYHGYRSLSFTVAGRAARLVVPHLVAAGRPWIWRSEFFDHEPQADLALLACGFHLAYLQVSDLYGCPEAIRDMAAFQDALITEHALAAKAVLEGFSRGGLYAVNYAATHPGRVAGLYLDAPVLDLLSWPGSRRDEGTRTCWNECLRVHGVDEAGLGTLSPIHRVAALARAGIPILVVVGDADEVVPVRDHTAVLESCYRERGAPITVIHKPFAGHHPHSLRDPALIVVFATAVAVGQPIPSLPPGTPFGYDYAVPRAGLDGCQHRFVRTGKGRVAFLGGSITESSGWRELVQGELRARFARTTFAFIDAGVASLGSTPHAFRYGRDVLGGGPIDLLIVEAAVNDLGNGMTDQEQVRGMEGIVRQARLAHPAIDILMLHFVDPDKLRDIRAGRRPAVIANHERVAEHYSIPSIDLAQEVAERIAAGEFTWEADFRDLHPAPFGHRLYAASVARLFARAWADSPATDAPPVAPRLPAPLDRASYFNGRLVSPNQAEELVDWTLDPIWRPSDGTPTRPGFVDVPVLVADRPGALLTLRFTGRAVGLFVTSGPDAGVVDFAIDGVGMGVRDLYTHWSGQLHLPWTIMLAADLADQPHVLTLRVAPTAHPHSRGHAVRIVHFLVN